MILADFKDTWKIFGETLPLQESNEKATEKPRKNSQIKTNHKNLIFEPNIDSRCPDAPQMITGSKKRKLLVSNRTQIKSLFRHKRSF